MAVPERITDGIYMLYSDDVALLSLALFFQLSYSEYPQLAFRSCNCAPQVFFVTSLSYHYCGDCRQSVCNSRENALAVFPDHPIKVPSTFFELLMGVCWFLYSQKAVTYIGLSIELRTG